MNAIVSDRPRHGKWVVVGLTIALLGLAIAGHRGPTVARGTPINHDDWSFSLEAVRMSPIEGPGTDQERLMIVTLRVSNRARRVAYRFMPGNVILSDESDRDYRIDAIEQGKLDESAPARSAQQPPIPAGGAATVDLVYRVPTNLPHPRLRISTGGAVGDFLESLTAGSKVFDLEP